MAKNGKAISQRKILENFEKTLMIMSKNVRKITTTKYGEKLKEKKNFQNFILKFKIISCKKKSFFKPKEGLNSSFAPEGKL